MPPQLLEMSSVAELGWPRWLQPSLTAVLTFHFLADVVHLRV